MRATGHFENTKDIELTLEFTTTLQNWSELVKEMSDRYPAWDFKQKIENMVWNAQKQISEQENI